MRVHVEFEGQRIGHSDVAVRLPFGGGHLVVTDSYCSLRDIVRDHARALRNHGYLPPAGAEVGGVDVHGDQAGRAALARGDALFKALTVCTDDGEMLATEDVWITDHDDDSSPGAFITFADP